MLKLTQVLSDNSKRIVYVAAAHVVAIYPDVKGSGCHIELITNTDAEGSVLHVKESAESVASHQFLNAT